MPEARGKYSPGWAGLSMRRNSSTCFNSWPVNQAVTSALPAVASTTPEPSGATASTS